MLINFGIEASAKKKGETIPVQWDSQRIVNGHSLLVGMSGAGKTHTLRRMVEQMVKSSGGRDVRVHVFDVHGDIEIEGESRVMFSEHTNYGLNPLRVNPDPHFGGVRKRVQGFIGTMNRAMGKLGSKQESTLRNIMLDVYERFGFLHDKPETWQVNSESQEYLSDGSDGKLYIDVPIAEKDAAKALGARWDPVVKCWYVNAEDYHEGITRWPPKMRTRTYPSIADIMRMARHIQQMAFIGAGTEAVSNLEAVNKASRAYQRKRMEALRKGNKSFTDVDLQEALASAKEKAVEKYVQYVESISSGKELTDIMRYDGPDVLKSVVNRLENLNAIGIFKPVKPPFDEDSYVWRYDIKALSKSESKMFVLYRLEEIFWGAMERGEQSDIVDVLVLDEAHSYADDDDDNIINTISKEGRKFGLAMICASQSPTHFTDDFVASVGTKIILGIDEMYWRASASKMRVQEEWLKWVVPQHSMLIQVKHKGETRNDWVPTIIPRESSDLIARQA